jgi:hypothetical protein
LEIDASDYVEAADHQRRLEEFVDTVRKLYPGVALRVSAGRETTRRRDSGSKEPAQRTPSRRVARYTDI